MAEEHTIESLPLKNTEPTVDPTMNYTTLRYEVRDRILTLTLDRPEQLNAFTVAMSH